MSTETVDTIETTSNQRPTFLTVLCILTFVVSGYHFIKGLFGLFSSDSFDQAQYEEAMAQMSEAMGSADDATRDMMEGFMEAMNATIQAGIENAMSLGLAEMLASGLSILGAYMMFKLKSTGYYVYIGAKVIGIIVPMALLGFNALTGFVYGLVAVVSILFIILYGLNRKYMN